MNKTSQNTSSVKEGAKKITTGVAITVILILAGLALLWSSQSTQEFTIIGVVDDVMVSEDSMIIQETKIEEDNDGNYDSEEILHTVTWDENTRFLPEDGQAPNEILSPLATVEVQISRQLTDNSVLAESIELIEVAPYRQ